jgi:hypothetical protein
MSLDNTAANFRARSVMGNKMAGVKVEYHSDPKETDEQIEARLFDRFQILDQLTSACIKGYARALIVSGPPGLGKSFTVDKRLSEVDPNATNHAIVKGYVRATGLIKKLYHYRDKGNVIVFDDSDAIFHDDNSLNLLKTVCDTTKKRVVSWLSEGSLVDEETAERIPKQFEFNGTIIFITNLDFDAMIEKGHKLAPHLQALVSRSHYIDLAMKTRRDYLVRVRQVIKQGLLSELSEDEQNDVRQYIDDNSHKLRELSLRMAIKIGNIRKTSENWQKVADVTCCKT